MGARAPLPGTAGAWTHPRALREAGAAARPGLARPGGPSGPLPALVQTRHGVDFRIPPPPPSPRGRGALSKGLRPETHPPACVFRAAPPPAPAHVPPPLPRPRPLPLGHAPPVSSPRIPRPRLRAPTACPKVPPGASPGVRFHRFHRVHPRGIPVTVSLLTCSPPAIHYCVLVPECTLPAELCRYFHCQVFDPYSRSRSHGADGSRNIGWKTGLQFSVSVTSGFHEHEMYFKRTIEP